MNIADNEQFPSMAFGPLSTDLDGQGRVVWRAFREEGGTATWGSDGVAVGARATFTTSRGFLTS